MGKGKNGVRAKAPGAREPFRRMGAPSTDGSSKWNLKGNKMEHVSLSVTGLLVLARTNRTGFYPVGYVKCTLPRVWARCKRGVRIFMKAMILRFKR